MSAVRPPTRFEPIADSRPDDMPWKAMSWPPPPDARLDGNHVALTRLDPERDTPELFAALDHDVVWRHVPGRPRSAGEHRQSLDQAIAAGRLPWLIRLLRDCSGLPAGTVVGTSSYLDVSPTDARLEIGSTAYTPTAWGSAVNPETKLLLLGYAFEVLGAGRVQLKTDVRNTRSQHAMARLGVHYEGTLRRYQRRDDGTVRDTVLFALLSEDWPSVRAGLRARLRSAE